MTREQLVQLFRTVHDQHRLKLALLANAERASPTSRREDLLAMELARGEAYLLLSQQGADAHVGPDVQRRLVEKGFDTDGIVRVIEQLEDLRDEHGVKLSMGRLKARIAETGASPSAVNIAAGQPVYLRALAEALLSAAERYGSEPKDALDFAELLQDPLPTSTGPVDLPPPTSARTPTAIQAEAQTRTEPGNDLPDGRVPVIAQDLIDRKLGSREDEVQRARAQGGDEIEARALAPGWDDKTIRQANYIFELFDRFLREEYNFNDLSRLRQHHLSAFEKFLRALPSTVGRSPADKHRSIAELRNIAGRRGPAEASLSAGTMNRHLGFLGQLLGEARSKGVVLDASLSTTMLRSAQLKRARNQRSVPDLVQLENLMHEPIFRGCASWDEQHKSGPHVYHRASYFGTLLALYSGVRRDEFAGLELVDVIDDATHPYLALRITSVRRLKNVNSIRTLAIHPEVIRLGFLDYVRELREIGHTLVFPDLFSPSTNSPMGDRFYDELRPALIRSGVTVHQLRHFFDNWLKGQDVSVELRADLMGHGGTSETDERYVDQLEISKQLKILGKLPNLTSHLEPVPIRLLPWVENKQIPPWSRAAKLQRKAERERWAERQKTKRALATLHSIHEKRS
jgi:integrase